MPSAAQSSEILTILTPNTQKHISWLTQKQDALIKLLWKEIKGFTLKIKAFTQVFKKLLFPFIYLLVWIFSKTKSKSKRKETVRKNLG